ncbi:Hypothetical protein A7982_00548 [Minicystis rosea]|nr:Hypothetical protein A7982_00548 [Minicystis rosea]
MVLARADRRSFPSLEPTHAPMSAHARFANEGKLAQARILDDGGRGSTLIAPR